jgi:hypothetical protein
MSVQSSGFKVLLGMVKGWKQLHCDSGIGSGYVCMCVLFPEMYVCSCHIVCHHHWRSYINIYTLSLLKYIMVLSTLPRISTPTVKCKCSYKLNWWPEMYPYEYFVSPPKNSNVYYMQYVFYIMWNWFVSKYCNYK